MDLVALSLAKDTSGSGITTAILVQPSTFPLDVRETFRPKTTEPKDTGRENLRAMTGVHVQIETLV